MSFPLLNLNCRLSFFILSLLRKRKVEHRHERELTAGQISTARAYVLQQLFSGASQRFNAGWKGLDFFACGLTRLGTTRA